MLKEQHDCGLLLFITEYVMLWKISTRTCSISCCFDVGSTVYISSQRFHAGVDLFDDFEKVSREESFTSNQQELKLYFSPILRVMTGTCDIVHKLAKNFHTMFIYKRWFLNRRTRNWCSKHRHSHFTCLFPRAEIQVNVY